MIGLGRLAWWKGWDDGRVGMMGGFGWWEGWDDGKVGRWEGWEGSDDGNAETRGSFRMLGLLGWWKGWYYWKVVMIGGGVMMANWRGRWIMNEVDEGGLLMNDRKESE